MDSFNLSLDQLAKETLDLSEQMTFGQFEQRDPFALDNEVIERVIEKELFPTTSGLIYKVEKTSGTFCVRALVASDISQCFEELGLGNQELFKKLKIESFNRNELNYFNTCSIDRAEIIFDQLANRRFPLDEDSLCNISDPGFSWWMGIGQGSFQIHFNSYGLNRSERFIKLGPLGDGSIAAMRFEKLSEHLSLHFPLSELAISNKSIKVSTAALDSKAFYQFQSMFTDGLNDSRIEDFAPTADATTLFLYLRELSDIRAFWIELENSLHS